MHYLLGIGIAILILNVGVLLGYVLAVITRPPSRDGFGEPKEGFEVSIKRPPGPPKP
jgi:hypothetical protein